MYETGFNNNNSSGSGEQERASSINVTFRVNVRIMNKLRTESEKRQTSLNAYINQILRQHVEWDLFEPKIGMIPHSQSRCWPIFLPVWTAMRS
ncbi:hypothetical protein NTE_00374 [Candidatus Nitrososphaera evergladensis SR1]|uniref:Uncharacterized protein n=1 Tax=Candidatus Nitrososphaera evergladensis SR1 TaxID=1459636 RepID=A0A075MLT1_9ARCH|nr:hypothetical protein NTE_00374 [Candidatus Nitrososphaera evergladensis SR1]